MDADCGYEWVRTGTTFTLGELCFALGQQYTAAQIYTFYRTLPLVAVKRRRQYTNDRGLVAATGATASSFRAVRRSLVQKPNKRQLLEEYAAANDLGQPSQTQANLDAAMRYLYNMLLRDLRPPWLTHAFPQALPGNGLLSKYTRPCFCNGMRTREPDCSVNV